MHSCGLYRYVDKDRQWKFESLLAVVVGIENNSTTTTEKKHSTKQTNYWTFGKRTKFQNDRLKLYIV